MSKLKLALLMLVMVFIALPLKANDHSVIATDNIEWGLLNPLRGDASPRAADLWGDRTKDKATGMLVKFKKGFSSPPHIHNITYRGVVIDGLVHNDDPTASRAWLPSGSFWTQPAGESHVTAASGQNNLIYLEIESGPYLVRPVEEAFDNGERALNLDERNLVWLDANDVKWIEQDKMQLAYLWGRPGAAHGSFVKLPAGFKGVIKNASGLKAIVVQGKARYQWRDEQTTILLSPASFFSSSVLGEHKINAKVETVIYINSNGRYTVE